MKVPVYLTTYERPGCFDRSISSLLKTDLSCAELHIWDDCSIGARKLFLLGQHKNVTRFNDNLGTKHMFLAVVKHFLQNYNSKYAVLTQDDVVYSHDWLNKTIEIASTVPRLGILTPWDRKANSNLTEQGYIIRNPVNNCQIGGPCWLITREFAKAVTHWLKTNTVKRNNGYDSAFQRLCYGLGFNVACTTPSYVQHVGIDSIARPGMIRSSSGYRASNCVELV